MNDEDDDEICPEHGFMVYPTLALALGGSDEALVLQQVNYWIRFNKKRNKNFYDGHYWVYNTYDKWQKELFHLSKKTIERIFVKLEKLKVIKVGRFNKFSMNRTKWYTIDRKVVRKLRENVENEINAIFSKENLQESEPESEFPSPQNSGLQNPKSGNGTPQNAGLINTPDLGDRSPQTGGLYSTETTSETTTETTKTDRQSRDRGDVKSVFDCWRKEMGHENAKLDEKRKGVIQKGLKLGYSPDELCKAIRGCSLTPFNMGDNDRGQQYNELHLILKDAAQIERFMRHADRPPKPMKASEKRTQGNITAIQRLGEKKRKEAEQNAAV